MKSILLFVAGASIAATQNLSGQPKCASSCLISAISAAGCAASDMGCQCGPTQAVIGASAAPCLLASCSGTELLQAQSAGSAQCRSYSATLTASPSASTTESSAASTRGNNAVASTSAAAPGASGSSGATAPTPASTGSTTVSTGAAAAATPAIVGAGALFGILGAMAAL